MKTLTLIITALWILAAGAGAQDKRWTWRPKGEAELRTLHASSLGQDGSAVVILGETQIKGLVDWKSYSGPVGKSFYRLVWLDAKGKLIFSKAFKTRDRVPVVQKLEEGELDLRVRIIDRNKMVFFNGQTLWTFTRDEKPIRESQIYTTPDSPIIAIFDVKDRFGGWLETGYSWTQFKYELSTWSGSEKGSLIRVKSISLWEL
jgi:hypothetical protein